ncbi:GNAT family N-acetyltransferase [Amycolatopsis anabasis]|uniref:bifunctional acetate--CoA ligase family protein/GNAT family N-acetyltransferase n=1 Tax=Amycolatopsis anabasis TaxID=1840409 RepID=UPI00131C15A0|nr:GNAT family N-acetyltransferase [Amycolatopsis anabasis]
MSSTIDLPGNRSVLTDGRVVLVRPLTPADAPEVLALHRRLSERDGYLRFFGPVPSRLDELAERFAAETSDRHAGVGAFLADRLIGVGNYEVMGGTREAELALVVDGEVQAGGVGTLLLEHLVSVARQQGIRCFVAVVLAENVRMTRVFRDLGLPFTITGCGPERGVELRLDAGETYLDAVAARERVADVASLRHVLEPRSIAVIGAGRTPESVGHAVLRNLLDGGFTGDLMAVNPHADAVLGVRCFPSVAALPTPPELAVVCVPAAVVPGVLEECGHAGVPAVVVITSGPGGTDLAAVRRHGMRLVGPNCIGVANTDPAVRMNATFLPGAVRPGDIGVMTQSGGIAIALAELLAATGLGISSLVSAGDKYDVSGNDLLLWWQQDPRTSIAVLYLESFGNPRKFGRLARTLAREKPVLAVRGGSTPAAQRAAASHTAAAATPAVTRDALFEQAGIIAVDSISELLDVLAALQWQSLPAGNRVAVLSNAGGAGVLTADACARHGLELPDLSEITTDRLRDVLPAQASVRNPVDTTAVVHPAAFGAAVDVLVNEDGIDAVLVAVLPTALGDPGTALAQRVALRGKPVILVRPGQPEPVRALKGLGGRPVTASYADPEQAAAALGHLARYSRWLHEPAGEVPELSGIDLPRAREQVARWLDDHPAGGWLGPVEVTGLLRAFGIPVIATEFAADEDAALALSERFGRPVAIKADAAGVLHKADRGGVVLDVREASGVRAAVSGFRERFGAELRGVVVQPMAAAGRELLVGIHSDEMFGPLVVFGLGGTDTDLIADRAARLAPLTDAGADRLVHALRCSPVLFGADTPLNTDAVREVLLRVGRLTELIPEIAELDLNPVLTTPEGCLVLDGRIQLRRRPVADPYLRYLKH